MNGPALEQLRTTLADTYIGGEGKFFAEESGMDLSGVQLTGPADMVWHDLLIAAEKQGRLERLVQRVSEGLRPELVQTLNTALAASQQPDTPGMPMTLMGNALARHTVIFVNPDGSTTQGVVEGDVRRIEPVQRVSNLQVAAWVQKQSFWPADLLPETLVQNLKLFYVAYWVISGEGSAQWEVDEKQKATCPTCKGTKKDQGFTCETCKGNGTTLQTVRTNTLTVRGEVKAALKNSVIENRVAGQKLECGQRQFGVVSTALGDENTPVLHPRKTNPAAASSLFEQRINDQLQNAADLKAKKAGDRIHGSVRLQDTETRTTAVETILYPIYFGTYQYKAEVRQVQADGVTGELHVEVPGEVVTKRNTQTVIIVGLVLLILLGFLVFSGIIPSMNRPS
jgi:hypothetical protein